MTVKVIIKRFWPIFLSVIILSAAIFLYFNSSLIKINSAGLQIEYKGPDQYASVFLDKQYLEKAPLSEKTIKSGDYILKIVPDDQDLAEFSIPITLTKGTLTVVTYNPGFNTRESSATIYEVEALPDSNELGVVSFESYPENALLSFNQEPTQYTPISYENLTPKEYTYSVSLPSYEMQEHTLQILAGYQIKVTVKLAKLSETVLPNEQTIITTPDSESTVSAQLDNGAEIDTLKDESWGVVEAELIVGSKVKIESTNFFINEQEVLRVREQPSITARELGFAKSNYYYPFAGDLANDFDSTASAQIEGWLKIKFEDQEGWVSTDFAELIVD